jgi:ABC-type Na+ transport system ATPase subunit NatA
MIETRGLTKRYGRTAAVSGLSFEVRPGRVTGFLGADGSGKSTTMRMIMGLDRPDAGQATIGGRAYRDLPWPMREVGGLLESRAFHPGRRADQHLAALAAGNGIACHRVDEVLGLVGLADVARTRAGKFSLGMAQRLGIAAALLGDPGVLVLDEPVNGLAIVVLRQYPSGWAHMSTAQRASFDPAEDGFTGLALGQLALSVLGALAITSEYSSGMVRATLSAVPRRWMVLAAKAAVLGALTLAAGELLAFAAFLAGQAVLATPAPHATLGRPGVLRAVLMAGAYLCLIGLYAVAALGAGGWLLARRDA